MISKTEEGGEWVKKLEGSIVNNIVLILHGERLLLDNVMILL